MFVLIDIGGHGCDDHESGEGADDDPMMAIIMATMMATMMAMKIKSYSLERKIL